VYGFPTHFEPQLLKVYYEEYGSGYLRPGVFEQYPETKTIPGYIAEHFGGARLVLDLGFGTGLWFWASFLRSLARLDGIDEHPEALREADTVFQAPAVPEGFQAAHARIGQEYTLNDLRRLQSKRGHFVFQDYRQSWPDVLCNTGYDLVTEHGGGFGTMRSDDEVIAVVRQVAQVLKPAGHVLFVNFVMAPSAVERRIGQVAAPAFCLREELFMRAVAQAGLRMVDFHALARPADMPGVEKYFYGYAEK
jgi:SAM-dependent methyltransferase